ncbi:unnamed protein product [Leuciscus chuanchicus]
MPVPSCSLSFRIQVPVSPFKGVSTKLNVEGEEQTGLNPPPHTVFTTPRCHLPSSLSPMPRMAGDFILRRSFYLGGYSTSPAWVQNEDRYVERKTVCVELECPWHCVTFSSCASRADAGHLSSGVADMVRQGMGRRAKTVPVSTSDLLALDQHACAIQPANTPLYAAGPNSKLCPAPLCREDNNSCLGADKIPPSLPPHTKVLPAVPTSITASLRYTSMVA